MAPVPLVSLVDGEQSEKVKKRFYIPGQDEFSSSSGPLNNLVLSSVLNAMPACPSSRKALKHGYIADLVREGGISPCSLLLGLIYIQRLVQRNPDYLATISSRDLFLVAMVVASKYMNDEGEMEALTNSEWSSVGCTPKSTLDQLERSFLKAIDWRLYVPLQEFYDFVGSAEGRVAMEQACQRGWTTYTDLTAMWENSDLQASMLKHTAKVAFSGVSLYLVCVSTLMAAVHPWALLSHTHMATPTFSGPAHPLQHQDGLLLQSAAPNLSTQQFDTPAQLLLASNDLGVSQQEAWPGGGRGGSCLWDPALLTSAVLDGGGGGRIAQQDDLKWPRQLLLYGHAPNHSHLLGSGRHPVQDTVFQDSKDRDRKHSDSKHQVISVTNTMEHFKNHRNGSLNIGHASFPTAPPPPHRQCNVSGPDHAPSPPVPTVHPLGVGVAEHHQRGTAHWHPLMNSSSLLQYHGGPLTFIAHYLTPQWVM